MQKKILISAIFLSLVYNLSYAKEVIIFEQDPNNPAAQVNTPESLKSDNSNAPFDSVKPDPLKTESSDGTDSNPSKIYDSDMENKDSSDNDDDVLFVQEDQPRLPHVDPWNVLVQATDKNYDILEDKLKNGQNVNQVVLEGNPMLLLGAMQNNQKQVDLALKYKANVHFTNSQGETALHWAAACASVNVIQSLLNANVKDPFADINKKDKLGRTPLHFLAMYNGSTENLNYLIAHHADINAKDNTGESVTEYAAALRKWDLVEVLLKLGASPAIKDNDNLSVEDFIVAHADIHNMARFLPYVSDSAKKTLNDKMSGYAVKIGLHTPPSLDSLSQ